MPSVKAYFLGCLSTSFLVLGLLLALMAWTGNAFAETYGMAGDWVVDADSHGVCLMSRTVGVENYVLGMIWDEKLKTFYWAFLVNEPDFLFMQLKPTYPTELSIADTTWKEDLTAEVVDASGFPYLFIRLPEGDFEQAFRRGTELSLTTKLGDYRVALDHSAAGLDIFLACMADPANRARWPATSQ